MILYGLASFIAFVLILSVLMKRTTRKWQEEEKRFWNKEQEANNVRRKSLDDLEYIKIPFEALPMNVLTEDERIRDCVDTLKILSENKIVNLTGITNTDLKLEYGTANITPLTAYDQSYTLLVCTLQKWADFLFEQGYISEARIVMEFAVSTRTDISKTYYTLAGIYKDSSESYKIKELIQTASQLQSSLKDVIVRNLKESYPYIG